jgi:multicomponent Na+:H+ antiporter subunit D
MLIGMGLTAFLCILIGVYPQILYNILPHLPVDYVPYTAGHIVEEMQLLLLAAFAFVMFIGYVKKTATITLDTDWFYRKAGRAFMWFLNNTVSKCSELIFAPFLSLKDFLVWFSRNPKRAIFMGVDILEYNLLGKIHGLSPEESYEYVRKEKRLYPGKPVRRDPVGDAVIVTLIFLIIYVIYYLL